jgi:hypothetical protein
MSESELAAATKWAGFWGSVENWAFLSVVLALAIEFAALRLGEPYKRAIEHAREVQLLGLKVELARLTAPRVVSSEQEERIIALTRPFTGMKFDATVFPDDAESLAYLEQLELILQKAGWIEIDWRGSNNAGPVRTGKPAIGKLSETGVQVQMHGTQVMGGTPTPGLWQAAKALAEALDPNGYEAKMLQGTNSGSSNQDAVHIVVGRKLPR